MLNIDRILDYFLFWPKNRILKRPIILLYVYLFSIIGASFIVFGVSNIKLIYKTSAETPKQASLMTWPNRGKKTLQNWTRRTIVDSLTINASVHEDDVWARWARTMHAKAANDLWNYLESLGFWAAIYEDGAYSEIGFIRKPVIVASRPVIRPGSKPTTLWVVQARILLSVRNSFSEINQSIDIQFKLLQDGNTHHESSVKIMEAWLDGK